MYTLRDDYRLCFHGSDARPWSEWAKRIPGPWIDASSPKLITLWTFLKTHEETIAEKVETVGDPPPRPILDVDDVPKVVDLARRAVDRCMAALSKCAPMDRMYVLLTRVGNELARAMSHEPRRVEFENVEARLKHRARETMRALQREIKAALIAHSQTAWAWPWAEHDDAFVPGGALKTPDFDSARAACSRAMRRWFSVLVMYIYACDDESVLGEFAKMVLGENSVALNYMRAISRCGFSALEFLEWSKEERFRRTQDWVRVDLSRAWDEYEVDILALHESDLELDIGDVFDHIERIAYAWTDESRTSYLDIASLADIAENRPTSSLDVARNMCADVDDALVDMYALMNELWEQNRTTLNAERLYAHERESGAIIQLKSDLEEIAEVLSENAELARTIEARWTSQREKHAFEYRHWESRRARAENMREHIERLRDAIERAVRYRMREMDCSLTIRDIEDQTKKEADARRAQSEADAKAKRAQSIMDAETERQQAVVRKLIEWGELRRENEGVISEVFERMQREGKSAERVVREMEREKHAEIARVRKEVLDDVVSSSAKRARKTEDDWDTSQHT